jgi:YNFM family putative membrane transporter
VSASMTGRGVARFGRRTFVIAAIAVWIAGILLTLVPSLPVIILGLAVASACGMACQASSTSYVSTSAKGGVSSAVGLYVTAFYIGGSVGAFVPGLLWLWGGWTGTVALVTGSLVLMGLVVTLFWSDTGKRQR